MRKITLALVSVITLLSLPVPAFADHNGTYHGRTWRDSRGQLRCRLPDGNVGYIVRVSPAGAVQGGTSVVSPVGQALPPRRCVVERPAPTG